MPVGQQKTLFKDWDLVENAGKSLAELAERHKVKPKNNQRGGLVGAILLHLEALNNEAKKRQAESLQLPDSWIKLWEGLARERALAAEVRAAVRDKSEARRRYNPRTKDCDYDPPLDEVVQVVVEAVFCRVVNNALEWARDPGRHDTWKGRALAGVQRSVTIRNVNELLQETRTHGAKNAPESSPNEGEVTATPPRRRCRPATRHASNIDAEFEEQMDPRAASPASIVSDAEAAELVAGAIPSLPYLEREVVVRWFYEEQTFREIAEQLGISEGVAKSIRCKALRRLRSLLSGRDGTL